MPNQGVPRLVAGNLLETSWKPAGNPNCGVYMTAATANRMSCKWFAQLLLMF